MSSGIHAGSVHTTDRPRIYDFRCKCGRVGVRRASTRLIKVTCRDCGADVEWWQSRPEIPFAKPAPSPELAAFTPAQIDAIRTERWGQLSRIAVVGDETGAIESNEPPADRSPAPSPMSVECSTDAIRQAANVERDNDGDREQLTLGEAFAPKPSTEGGGI